MNDLALATEVEIVDSTELDSLSLDELAKRGREAGGLARLAGVELLRQSIYIGEILESVSKRMTGVELEEWAWTHIHISRTTAHRFRRFAKHQQALLDADPANIQEAEFLLMGSAGSSPRITDEECLEVRRMYDEGMTWSEIAIEKNLSKSAVWRRLHRTRSSEILRGHNKKSKRSRDEIRRARRDRAAKNAGGNIGEAYSRCRKMAEAIDRALEDVTDSESRASLSAALSHVYKAEDEIIRALGVA